MLRKIVLFVWMLYAGANLHAQESASFHLLNTERIHTNETGMKILGAWGIANIIEGGTGYAIARDDEWRSFHAMNAIWGVVNLGIAGAGYAAARKERLKTYSCSEASRRYKSTRRLYLINAGLDGIYIASGIFLTAHAKHESNHPEVWLGFGKSFIFQGTGLLLFDAVMYSAHGSHRKAWYKVLQGVCLTGDGIGMRYVF